MPHDGSHRAMTGLMPGVDAQVRPKRRAPITRVLLVGGATRMPAFRRFVRNMTGLEAKGAAVDPDEVRLRRHLCGADSAVLGNPLQAVEHWSLVGVANC